MTHGTSGECAYTTERLLVGDWRELVGRYDLDRVAIVREILTSATTADLPTEWRGDYDEDRAERWIAARDAESPTLLAVERGSRRAVGVVVVFDLPSERDPNLVDIRLGYVLAESAWGRGLATELVAGLVAWARSEPRVASVSGGVAPGNDASAQVLTKNGFRLSRTEGGQRTFVRSTI